MNIVMPMAGRGSRFADAGVDTPKPLIDVRGRPMYAWAMDSLPLDGATRVIFLCLAEHLTHKALEQDILTRYANLDPIIVPVDKVTDGQACTVLLAREHIDNGAPLVIYNADTFCRTDLSNTLATQKYSDAALTVFEAEGDQWSFARINSAGHITATAEKRRISQWATTGLYHFARGADFVRYADAMIKADERSNGEFYVAPVYNRLIADGARVVPDYAEEVWVLGTPEDLTNFEANYPR